MAHKQLKGLITIFYMVFCLISCSNFSRPNEKGSFCDYSHDQKMWALGTCAIINEINRDHFNILGGREKNNTNSKLIRERILDKWWGITNRSKFMKTLNWIEKSGDRVPMYREGMALSKMTSDEFLELLKSHKNNQPTVRRLSMARYGYSRYGEKSIIAWDYGRYIALCGWGYIVGYLSENEAWKLIMPKAKELQTNFKSWTDMGENYLQGRAYWPEKPTEDRNRIGREAWSRLAWDKKNGPWQTLDWQTDLSCK